MNNYYLIIDGKKKGPYPETRIQNMWKEKHIEPGTKCLMEGETNPRPIEDFPEITSPITKKTVAARSAAVSPTATAYSSPKDNTAAMATPASPLATTSTSSWKIVLILLVGIGIGAFAMLQFGGKGNSGSDANATAPKTGPDANATAPKKGEAKSKNNK